MIGILGAMDIEVAQIKGALTSPVTTSIHGIDFTRGQLEGREVVVAQCGIGKVNAAACAQMLIDRFGPALVINVGVGGSLSPDLRLGDIAVARRVVQHDVDTTALGDPAGYVSTVNKVFFDCDEAAVNGLLAAISDVPGVRGQAGVIATGDQFINSASVKARIVERFGAICCDMESGAIAQVCLISGVPFAAVRAISDNADDDSHMDYPQFTRMAASHSTEVLSRFASRSFEE